VEGPAFPAQVKEALLLRRHVHDRHNIPVNAIGGLDVETIPAQVNSGAFVPHCCADGVAVIRAPSWTRTIRPGRSTPSVKPGGDAAAVLPVFLFPVQNY
jgi:hypothetical protein